MSKAVVSKEDHPKRKEEPLAAMVDKYGNAITRWNGGTYTLYLVSEKRKRIIGVLNDSIMYMERKAEHYHRKYGGYGFNYWLLVRSTVFEYVIMTCPDGRFKIPRQTIISMGKVFEFKYSGDGNSFEIQIFLKMSIIKPFKLTEEI